MTDKRYRAFMSYSHRDKAIAEWLHRALETYRLPAPLVEEGERRRLRPIFKDRDELPVTDDLGEAIERALAESEALIVLCSPHAAISPWIAKEIDIFKRLHGDRDVYPVVVDGDPPHNIPPPLLTHYEGGAPTEDIAEPVAADLRPQGDGRKLGLMKLIAGLAGVELDALVDREAQRKHKRMATVAVASIVGMLLAVGLAWFAVQQRDAARAERAEANGLIEYMLTDLRDQLEPVGRLEVLDGVGARAMDYYARQDIASLSPEELGRRARAVQLVAEMHNLRGDNDKALPAFREASRTTGELLARSPDDPERMYNHGQSLFWVGYIAWQRGQMEEAKQAFDGYADISTRLAERDRANLDWQMEEAYALSNLGTLASEEGRYEDALPLFKRSVAIVERVAEAEDRPTARMIEIGEGLSWVASTQQLLGDFKASAETRAREVALYGEILDSEPDNYDAMRSAMFAESRMGWLHDLSGRARDAGLYLDRAIAKAERLLAVDSSNTLTFEMAYPAYQDRALYHWRQGRAAAASADYDEADRLLADLRARDNQNQRWNVDQYARLELQRALTDRASLPPDQRRRIARRWIDVLKADSNDHVWALIAAHMVEARAHNDAGNRAAAAASYARAIAIENVGEGININALALKAVAADRLGQTALARDLRAELRQRGIDPGIDDRLGG